MGYNDDNMVPANKEEKIEEIKEEKKADPEFVSMYIVNCRR